MKRPVWRIGKRIGGVRSEPGFCVNSSKGIMNGSGIAWTMMIPTI